MFPKIEREGRDRFLRLPTSEALRLWSESTRFDRLRVYPQREQHAGGIRCARVRRSFSDALRRIRLIRYVDSKFGQSLLTDFLRRQINQCGVYAIDQRVKIIEPLQILVREYVMLQSQRTLEPIDQSLKGPDHIFAWLIRRYTFNRRPLIRVRANNQPASSAHQHDQHVLPNS